MRTPEAIYSDYLVEAGLAIDESLRGVVEYVALEVMRAMQRETIEACAKLATSFLVGDPKNGVPLHRPSAHQIADAIRALATGEAQHGTVK